MAVNLSSTNGKMAMYPSPFSRHSPSCLDAHVGGDSLVLGPEEDVFLHIKLPFEQTNELLQSPSLGNLEVFLTSIDSVCDMNRDTVILSDQKRGQDTDVSHNIAGAAQIHKSVLDNDETVLGCQAFLPSVSERLSDVTFGLLQDIRPERMANKACGTVMALPIWRKSKLGFERQNHNFRCPKIEANLHGSMNPSHWSYWHRPTNRHETRHLANDYEPWDRKCGMGPQHAKDT